MMKLFHKWLLAFFLLAPSFLHANIIRVNDLGDPAPSVAGNTTLRDAISLAATNDTVIIDIKGTIALSSPLAITKSIFIMGPYPIHSTIDINGPNVLSFNLPFGDTIALAGVKIINSGGPSSGTAVFVAANTKALLRDCVLKSHNATVSGGAVLVAGNLIAKNCSFINNTSSAEGGAVYISNGSEGSFQNCTFSGNNAMRGGAVSTGGVTPFTHCTFKDNNASDPGPFKGHDIELNFSSGNVALSNNIFAKTSGSANQLSNSALGLYSTSGGNMMTFSPTVFSAAGSDLTYPIAAIGIPALTTDGYGLEYYKLSSSSSIIDKGQPGSLPPTDTRRAPRVMHGGTSLSPDPGAVEYTPYGVTVADGSFSTAGSLHERIFTAQGSGIPPFYIDFLLPSPSGATQVVSIGIPSNMFVDGYSQVGSQVPGPGTIANTVTPAITGYNVIGPTAVAISVISSNVRIHGLAITDNNVGVSIGGSTFNHQISGCVFSNSAQSGIRLSGSSNDLIGGDFHHQRNVINGYDLGIEMSPATSTKVYGNFIGTDATGFSEVGPNNTAILCASSGSVNIGGDRLRGRGNVISGNDFNGIRINFANNTTISGNYIGLNYQGLGVLGNDEYGIRVEGTCSNVKIGKAGKDCGNYICNTDVANLVGGAGVIANTMNGSLFLYNNTIGLNKNNVPAPNPTGVHVNSSTTVNMGDGSAKNRNIISGNIANGLYIYGSSNSGYYNKNFIGIDANNDPKPNGASGIYMSGGPQSSTIINNVISSHTNQGVLLVGAGNNNSVSGNFIGTDSSGMSAMGNMLGIFVSGTGTGTIIASNVISGNAQEGISIETTSGAVIRSNIIGLNLSTNAAIPNFKGIYAYNCSGLEVGTVTGGNIVSGNTNIGVELSQCSNFKMLRNKIGTNDMLAAFGNGAIGVSVINSSSLGKIGMNITPVDSNSIMYNNAEGVFVAAGCTNIDISANRIASNGALGISLNNLPTTTPLPNDLNDPDGAGSRGNAGQNYPVLTAATNCGGSTKVAGNINVDVADGSTAYRVDFYSINSGVADASGHGEGEHYIGSISLIPGTGMNTLDFSTSLPGAPLSLGTKITATCSKKTGSTDYATSEFSANVIVSPPVVPDATVLTNVSCNGGTDGSATVTTTAIAPLTFQWFTGATAMSTYTFATAGSLAAGTYHCMVTDGTGCVNSSDTVTITEPPILLYTLTPVGETCAGDNNGSFSVVINSGGTPIFTIKLYNGLSALVNTYPSVVYGATTSESNLAPGNYAVLIIDANGCKDSIPFNIAFSPNNVTGFFTTSGATCLGSGTGFADLSTGIPTGPTSWQWDFGDFTTSTFMNPSHVYSAAGTYTVTLIVGNGSCDDTVSTTVTVDPLPTVNAGLDMTVCESVTTVALSGTSSAPTVSWSSPGGASVSPSTALSTTYGPFSTVDQTNGYAEAVLTATDGACTVRDTVVITIEQNPTVMLGTDLTECSSNIVALVPSTIADEGTVSWSTSGLGTFGTPSSVNTTYNPGADAGSAVTITFTATSLTGACPSASDALVLTVNNGPTANAGTNYAVCYSSGSVTMSGAATNYTSVSWSVLSGTGTMSSFSTLNPTYTFSALDEGSVVQLVLSAQNPPCAPAVDTISITVDEVPVVNAGLNNSVCAGTLYFLTGSISNAAMQVWTATGGGVFSNQFALSTTYTTGLSSGNDTLSLISGANGACNADTNDLILTVLPLPVADAGTDATVCAGSAYLLDGSASTGAVAYDWKESGVTFATTATASVTPAATTMYILTVTNTFACNNSDTVTITTSPLPDPLFLYPAFAFCADAGLQLPSPHTPGGTYSVVSGALSVNATTGELDPSSATGIFDIVYTLTSPCLNADTISITIDALPAVSVSEITSDYVMCPEDTLHFTGTPAGGTYTPLLGLNTTTGDYIGFFATAGVHNIVYTYTDGTTGCSATDSKTVTVNASPVVSFSPTLAASYCASDGPILLTGTPAGGGFALNGTISVGTTYNYDPSTPGTDSIAYGYIDLITGCGNFSYQLVTVTSAPATPILTTAAPYEFCGSVPQTLTVSNPATFTTWYSNSGLTDVITTGANCSSSLLSDGTNTAYVVNKTSGTCISTPLLVTYTNHTFNDVVLGGPYETCAGTPVQIMLTVPGGITSAWLPADGLVDTTALQPMVAPTETNTYVVMLSVTSLPSCVMYDSVTVTVTACSLENVTNAFTPDGDGTNETWIIAGIEQHPENRVVIFNRWGDKLIELNGYNNTSVVWDGRYNGAMVATGTYYFTIEYMDDGQQKAGWIQLNY